MTNQEARDLILMILGEADYDLVKSFDPELSEDPEEAEHTMRRLIDIVHHHVPQTIAQRLADGNDYDEESTLQEQPKQRATKAKTKKKKAKKK